MRWDDRSRHGAAVAAVTVFRDLVRSRLFSAEPLRPLYAVWYVTLRCNLACAFCDDGTGTKYPAAPYPELGSSDARRLLRAIRDACASIYFTGGEPLVHRDIFEMLAAARQLGFWPIFLNTNLSLPLGSQTALDDVDVLIVSLSSTEEANNDRVIGRPHQTRRILENLASCAQHQEHGGPQVVVNCVISAGRVEDTRAVWDFCRRHRIWFSPVPENRGLYVDEELRLEPAYSALVNDILAARKRGEWIYGTCRGLATLLHAQPFRCYPTLTPHIYPNGDLLYPCHPLRNRAANILEQGSLQAAWGAVADPLPLAPCGSRCHLPCYVNNNGWMEHPIEGLIENIRLAGSHRKGYGTS